METSKTRLKVVPKVVALPVLLSVVLLTSSCGQRMVLNGGSGRSEKAVSGALVPGTTRVWFVKSGKDELEYVPVERRYSGQNKLKLAVEDLLRGPSPDEEREGIASEIPKGTVLLGVRGLDEDEFEIDLSRRFASGGGSTSIETRVEQLKRTVTEVVGTKKVFLNVEGQRLFAAAGEGLEIKQPINWN